MKNLLKTLLFITLFSISINGISQPAIRTDSVIQISLCAGSDVYIPFTVTDTGGTFVFGNFFTAQISDQFGSFANPVDIGTFPIPWTLSAAILGTVPVNSPLLGIYKIRVIGSDPPVIGSESPNFVLILNTAVLSTINADDSVMCEGDSLVLTATPIFQSYQWNRNGTSISGASSQTLTVSQAGAYTVTVKDTFQCVSTSDPFNVYIETCVGVEEPVVGPKDLNVYPVPALDIVDVEFNTNRSEEVDLQVYDLLGKVMITEHLLSKMGANHYSLDLSILANGVYLLRVGRAESSETVKLVKY
ncbi:T9SS type A sorting domain-containing protein [Flavobacteriales bacterium AH-315-E23]|nr:T9SS type A sorting domain-containing protein [Flavobacteriales bacterium AH-315-E23]